MNANALTPLDWTVVAAYFAFVVWLGLRCGRKQRSSERYFLGGRNLPGWAVGISMFATIISSWAFLALPAKAFQSDLQYLMAIALVPVATWIAARWIVPLLRDRIRLSAYEYLETRFGLGARLYGNLAFLIVHFGKMAAILYLLCLAVAEMTGWNIFVLIAVVGVATLVYTYFGGIEGVVWTDVAQGALLLFAGFVALGYILWAAPGGPVAVIETAWHGEKFKLATADFAWDRSGLVVLLVFGLNFYLQKFIADQTVVQRYLLAPSAPQAARALWLSSGCVMLVWVLFMSLGALLWAYYRLQPGLLPAAQQAQPDKVFPYFIGHELPAGISGLVLAGLLAASMSTLASDLNSLSAVVFDDYYRRFRRRESEAAHLLFSRLVVLVAGLSGILLAMAMTRIHSMADAAFDFVSLVGGGVLGMYLLGLLTRRGSTRGLYAGLSLGVAVMLWAEFCGPGKTGPAWLPHFPLHNLWVGLLGNLVVLCCGYVASRLLPAAHATPAPLLSHDQTIKDLS